MKRTVTVLMLAGLLIASAISPALASEPSDTVGVVDSATGKWFLRDPATEATTSFFYGDPGDYPLMGDWDCDGVDTPGLYRQTSSSVCPSRAMTMSSRHSGGRVLLCPRGLR